MEVFFGRRWDEPIAADDSGSMMAYANADGTGGVRPVHIECFLRSSLGDVPHLEHRCRCAGGSDHDDRPYRVGSRAALDWMLTHHYGRFVP